MKKNISMIIVVMIIALTISGCGGGEPAETVQATEAAQASVQPAAQIATEAPTLAPTEAPTEPPVQVDPSWFDDAVFIGDSVTVALDYYCASDYDILGDAQFVCGTSLGYHNALLPLDSEYAVHPTYQGETVLAETAAQVTGANKVFIMLGVNDIGTYGADDTLETAYEFADRILSHTPDVEIYFQSTAPMVADQESGWLNNDKISDFNSQLKDLCEERGYHFIDIYHQVCDEEGALREDYCSDIEVQGIHFNTDGCDVWAQYLRIAVAEQ